MKAKKTEDSINCEIEHLENSQPGVYVAGIYDRGGYNSLCSLDDFGRYYDRVAVTVIVDSYDVSDIIRKHLDQA